MNFKTYISEGCIYGKLMLLIGILIIIPVLALPFYPDEWIYAASFAAPSLVSIALGFAACRVKKTADAASSGWQSSLQKGSLPVLFAWCFGFAAGAAPFFISRKSSLLHAAFESVSGWTTTGLTVMDVTALPRIFLFHRSFMQYCGGLGFILMILLLVGGKQAINLYDAEGHPDRLMPTLKRTVQTIVSIYTGVLALGTLLYSSFGMPPFDAVCHTMSALSTAGFTTQQNSIGQYGSYPIEVITILLMLVGATNFAVLLLFTEFKFRKIIKVSELRFMFGLIAIFTPLIAISLMVDTGMGVGASLRQSLFGIVTVFTTTGYSTMNYAQWPDFAVGMLIVLMIIGGSIGSTAGGIKLGRAYLLLRIAYANIKKRLSSPRRITAQNYNRVHGKAPINGALIADTLSFVFCYIIVFVIGTLLITLTEGCGLYEALFEFASAFGTVGISNGLTNASTSSGTLIIEMIGMVLGRLEVFIVFIGIHAGIIKINDFAKRRLNSRHRDAGIGIMRQ